MRCIYFYFLSLLLTPEIGSAQVTFTEFPVPTGSLGNGSSLRYFITSGSDGNLWFTEYLGNKGSPQEFDNLQAQVKTTWRDAPLEC